MSDYRCWLCHDSGWLAHTSTQAAILTSSPYAAGKCDPPSADDVALARRRGLTVSRCHVCGDGKDAETPVKLYCVEERHLDKLKALAAQLLVEGARDRAVDVLEIVRYAESLDALRRPGGPPYLHMTEKKP